MGVDDVVALDGMRDGGRLGDRDAPAPITADLTPLSSVSIPR
jgi:hypothetical protein